MVRSIPVSVYSLHLNWFATLTQVMLKCNIFFLLESSEGLLTIRLLSLQYIIVCNTYHLFMVFMKLHLWSSCTLWQQQNKPVCIWTLYASVVRIQLVSSSVKSNRPWRGSDFTEDPPYFKPYLRNLILRLLWMFTVYKHVKM